MEFALTAPSGLMTPTDLVMPEELPCGILRVLRLRRFDLDPPKWWLRTNLPSTRIGRCWNARV
jgi:hypothetical protein